MNSQETNQLVAIMTMCQAVIILAHVPVTKTDAMKIMGPLLIGFTQNHKPVLFPI